MAGTAELKTSLIYTDATTSEVIGLTLAATTISGLTSANKRHVVIPTSEVTMTEVAGTVGSGTLTDIEGLLIINRDETNYITIGLKKSGENVAYFKIPPSRPYFLWTDEIESFEGGDAFSAFSALDTVTLQANSDSCVVEFIVIE